MTAKPADSVIQRILVKRNPATVRSPKRDPRTKRSQDYIRELAADIGRRGLRNPPYIAKNGDFEEIVTGEHRRLAMVQLGWTEGDFFLIDGTLTEADLAIERLQEAEMHKGFSFLEKAAAFQTLLESGLSQAEIAERTGKTETEISKALKIKGNLAADLQEEVETAKLPVSCAWLLASLSDPVQQRELADKLRAGLLKRDSLEAKIKALLGKPKAKAKPVKVSVGGIVIHIESQALDRVFAALTTVDNGLKKLEKHGLPLSSLPQILRGN